MLTNYLKVSSVEYCMIPVTSSPAWSCRVQYTEYMIHGPAVGMSQ